MNADRTPPLPGWLPWLVMGLFLTAAIWVVVVHEVEQRDLRRRRDASDTAHRLRDGGR